MAKMIRNIILYVFISTTIIFFFKMIIEKTFYEKQSIIYDLGVSKLPIFGTEGNVFIWYYSLRGQVFSAQLSCIEDMENYKAWLYSQVE